MSLEYLGSSATNGYRNLLIQESPVTPAGGSVPSNVLAGGFEMRDNTANSALGTFVAWCLDLTHWLGGAGSSYAYETTDTPFNSSDGLTADQQTRVQGLFDAAFHLVDPLKSGKSAGFQMALWEVLYDDDYSLTAGTTTADGEFRGIAGSTKSVKAIGRAEEYLAAASSYTGVQNWNLTFLESLTGQQNLVTVSSMPTPVLPAPVPLPAAGFMLLAGLAGLGVAGRRRRKS